MLQWHNSVLDRRIKVNESVYIAKSGQRHDKSFNNFLLHVKNQALTLIRLGFLKGFFSGGGVTPLPSYFKKNLSIINIEYRKILHISERL